MIDDLAAQAEEEPIALRVERFRLDVERRIASAASFEETAHIFADEFYSTFRDFTMLARVFAIVPCRRLVASERAFLGDLSDDTPVLTLFGTRGIEDQWNDRRLSRGHRAIPLVSEAFVEDAPMIAKLLAELGTSPFEQVEGDWQFVKGVERGGGLFFVGDARTTTDLLGRPVIPAIDFVERYRIRTVFGFGGRSADGSPVVFIVFCRKTFLRRFAEEFVSLTSVLCDAPAGVARGPLFRPD